MGRTKYCVTGVDRDSLSGTDSREERCQWTFSPVIFSRPVSARLRPMVLFSCSMAIRQAIEEFKVPGNQRARLIAQRRD
jgi:hypothetical protein